MKRKILSVISLITALTLLLITGCSQTSTGQSTGSNKQPAQKVTIRFAGSMPNDHYISKAMNMMKQQVEEKSKGSIVVQVYPNSQLYKATDMADVITNGSVEMGLQWGAEAATKQPVFNLTYMPFLFDSPAHVYRYLNDPEVKGILDKAATKNNEKVLTWVDAGGTAGLVSTKLIKTVADYKGLRVRPVGDQNFFMMQRLGAAPINVNTSEVYTSLQYGNIDSVLTTLTSDVQRKYYEVAKHLSLMPSKFVYLSVGTFAMNLNTWNKLTPDQQKIFLDAAHAEGKFIQEEARKDDKDSLEFWKKNAIVDKFPASEVQKIKDLSLEELKSRFVSSVGKDTADKLLEAVERTRK